MDLTEKNNNITEVLVMTDFEKAFDSIEWSFIKKTLNLINFGVLIFNWVKVHM